MNMDMNPTIANLIPVFDAAVDEAGHHCLWIDASGDVHLDLIPKNLNPVGFEESKNSMAVRFETYVRGAGYVGPQAARDSDFLKTVLRDLKVGWAARQPGKVVYYDGYPT